MAFKILTEKEKEFLTEKELEIYEEKLRIYLMRVDFVNQLDKFENAEIKPYTARKVPVKTIKKVQISDVLIPEMKIKNKNIISEKISGYKLLNKVDSDKKAEEMTPKIKISNNDKLYSIIKKCDDMPSISVSVKISSVKIVKKQCDIPQIRETEIPSAELKNMPKKSELKNNNAVKISMPVSNVSEINTLKENKMSEIRCILPKSGIKEVKQPEIKQVNLKKPFFEKYSISGIDNDRINVDLPKVSDRPLPSTSVKVPEHGLVSPVKANKLENKDIKLTGIPQIKETVSLVGLLVMPGAPSGINTNNIKRIDPENYSSMKFNKPEFRNNIEIPEVPELKKIKIKMPGLSIRGISERSRPDTEGIREKTDAAVLEAKENKDNN